MFRIRINSRRDGKVITSISSAFKTKEELFQRADRIGYDSNGKSWVNHLEEYVVGEGWVVVHDDRGENAQEDS